MIGNLKISVAERIVHLLLNMKEHGQSVTLNWGEDNGLWECSWITSGKRYSGFSDNMLSAVLTAYMKAIEAVDVHP